MALAPIMGHAIFETTPVRPDLGVHVLT